MIAQKQARFGHADSEGVLEARLSSFPSGFLAGGVPLDFSHGLHLRPDEL